MPKYVLPEETEGEMEPEVAPGYDSGFYRPTVYLPVSKEILKELDVGQEVEVVITGKVTSLEQREHAEGTPNREISVKLASVAVNPEDYSRMVEDD